LLDESKRLRTEAVAAAAVVAPLPVKVTNESNQNNKLNQEKKKPLKKELEKVEPKLAALEAEKEACLKQLLEPLNPKEIAEASKRLKRIEQELATLEARWLEINEALEAI
jgi:ATP-binding cassette subfamily F protein 3